MKREHLYKAVSKRTGEWVEGDLASTIYNTSIRTKGVTKCENPEYFTLDFGVHPETVCQLWRILPGGTRLFEGDKICDPDGEYEYFIIEWDDEEARLRVAKYGYEFHHTDVTTLKRDKDITRLGFIEMNFEYFKSRYLMGNIHDRSNEEKDSIC